MKHASVLVFTTSIAIVAAAPGSADILGQSGKTVECFCTDKTGSRVELGDTICMFVDGKMFIAQCQMSLNVPMWRKLSDGCPSVDATPFSQPETGWAQL